MVGAESVENGKTQEPMMLLHFIDMVNLLIDLCIFDVLLINSLRTVAAVNPKTIIWLAK
jgi:hypothetical protein